MVFYSRYYIHEMLLVFFTALAAMAWWRYGQSGRFGWCALAGVGLGLMWATKETFVFAVLSLTLAAVCAIGWPRWRGGPGFDGVGRCHVKPIAAAAGITLHCDRWTASSVLQKAIRRGHAKIAQRAAVKLEQEIRSDVLRRLLVIGFEDIGAANPDVLVEIGRAVGSPAWRDAEMRDQLLIQLVTALAESPKDRSTDYLISAIQHQSACREFGERCRVMIPDEQREVLADFTAPLEFRSVAALAVSGLEAR